MHELEEQHAGRFRFDAAPMRSGLPRIAGGRTGAQESTAEPFSARLLATHDHQLDAAVLSVRGEIDLGTAPALRKALLPVLERQTGPVVVDLSEVAFMDSTGVHILADTHERLRLQNRRLAIACREGGQVHRILALVGLVDALTVYHPREGALIGADVVPSPGPRRTRGPSTARTLTQRPSPIGSASRHDAKAS